MVAGDIEKGSDPSRLPSRSASTLEARGLTPLPASPAGVVTLAPEGAIAPTGTWAIGARGGDFVFVAGMRGIDPETGHHFDDTRRYLDAAALGEAERTKIFETNARRVYPRLGGIAP